MGRGENFTNKEGRRTIREEFRRFFEKEFDWIALLLIAAVILLSLVFF